jgi:hypothetical protein
MNDTREIYIDSGIHKYIDIVFGRTYFLELSQELKSVIQSSQIKIDYNTADSKAYSPFYDCLYYPTVSTTKCGDQFDANDWQKLEEEIEKHLGKNLPTYQIYSTRRLNNELCYFLKNVFQATLHPQELSSNIGFEYFLNQYWFLYNNFPDKDKKEDFKHFWVKVLENLKNDQCVTRMSFDGQFRPLGNYVINSLDWLTERIS